MTDTGESPDDDDADDKPPEPAAPARDGSTREKRHRAFERVTNFLYGVRRTRVAKRLPNRFLKPVDYLINVIFQYRDLM
jgi:hypothetical protein